MQIDAARTSKTSHGTVRAARVRAIRLSFGEQVLVLYFFVFYIFPMTVDYFWDVGIKYYLIGDLSFTSSFFFALFYLAVLISLRKVVNLDVKIKAPFRKIISSRFTVSILFLALFVASFAFSLRFSSSFRHTGSYSEAGMIPIFTFSLKAMCSAFVFASISEKSLIKLNGFHYALFIASFVLSFVSSNDVLFVFLAAYAWGRASRIDLLRLVRKLFRKVDVFLAVSVVPLIVFGGMANKLGVEGAIEYFQDGGLRMFLELFTNRIFYHSYSMAYHLNNFSDTIDHGLHALNITTFQTFRRFAVLLGVDAPNYTLETVSRLNYLLISGYDVESDAGASPGLLASIFFIPGSILALPIHIICISNAVAMFDNIMGKTKYSPIVLIGALVLLQAITDSFMDNFNLFSIGFIFLMTLFFLSSYARTIPDPAVVH